MARLVNRVANPFIHRDYLSEARAHEFAHEMADGLKSLPERPRSLAIPILFSFANKALLMCVLVSIFLAFKVPFSAGTIIGGFAIAYLFLIISPTPAGIGIVEGHHAAGAFFAARSLERGRNHHACLSRHHILGSIGNWRICISNAEQGRKIIHASCLSSGFLET